MMRESGLQMARTTLSARNSAGVAFVFLLLIGAAVLCLVSLDDLHFRGSVSEKSATARILGSTNASLNVTVTDEVGRKMAGAEVHVVGIATIYHTMSEGWVNITGLYANDSSEGGTEYFLWAAKTDYSSSAVENCTAFSNATVNKTLYVRGGMITGIVKDTSGRVLSGANVSISTPGYFNISGADGWYRLKGMPGGTHYVTASALGYDNRTETVTLAVGDVAVRDFQLKAQTGSISGYVFSEIPYAPLSGANVSIKIEDLTVTSTTDDNGSYAVTGVPAGTYTLTASLEGFVSGTISNVNVTRGEETKHVNFTLKEKPTRLYGVVRSGTLLLVAANITVVGTGFYNLSDVEGFYEIRNITAGTYTVNATLPGYVTTTVSDVVIPRGGEKQVNINLVALPGAQLRGAVVERDNPDDGISGVIVTIVSGATKDSKSTQTNIKGEFEFTGLSAGSYTIQLEKSGYRPMEITGIALLKDQITVRNFTMASLREGSGGFIFGFDLPHSMMILALFLTIVILAIAVYLRIRTFQAPESAPAVYDQAEEEEGAKEEPSGEPPPEKMENGYSGNRGLEEKQRRKM